MEKLLFENGEWRKDDLRKEKLLLRMENGERMVWESRNYHLRKEKGQIVNEKAGIVIWEWRLKKGYFENGEIIIWEWRNYYLRMEELLFENGEWKKDNLRKEKLLLRMEKGWFEKG